MLSRTPHHALQRPSRLNMPEHASVRDRCVTERLGGGDGLSKCLILLVEPRSIELLRKALKLLSKFRRFNLIPLFVPQFELRTRSRRCTRNGRSVIDAVFGTSQFTNHVTFFVVSPPDLRTFSHGDRRRHRVLQLSGRRRQRSRGLRPAFTQRSVFAFKIVPHAVRWWQRFIC